MTDRTPLLEAFFEPVTSSVLGTTLGTETFTKTGGEGSDRDERLSSLGTETLTRAREESDLDESGGKDVEAALLGTETGTATREEMDQDVPRTSSCLGTQTFTEVRSEQPDQDAMSTTSRLWESVIL
ncbi:MAG TPA: hypothetical protein VJT32_02780 [bacterium]|nr:hypothetical protein [bacterium]